MDKGRTFSTPEQNISNRVSDMTWYIIHASSKVVHAPCVSITTYSNIYEWGKTSTNMLCDIRRHCSMAFNREPCQKEKDNFSLLFLSRQLSPFLFFSTPVSISQLAPASHERSHFFFAVASRVSCAAMEVCDEVAFLVDAWLKRTGQ
jgi:hypothetical protein